MTTATMNVAKSLVLAVVASAGMLAFAAAPAEAAEVREARIAVASGELATPAGRSAVDGRVMAAAQQVCGEGGLDIRNPNEVAGYRLCVANAVRDARLQMAALGSRTQLASR